MLVDDVGEKESEKEKIGVSCEKRKSALPGIPAVEQVGDLAVGSGKYLGLVLTSDTAVMPTR